MSSVREKIKSPSGDLGATNGDPLLNWNRLYVLVLLFNVVLVVLFYLLGHFVNHHGA
ncbi:MAG: hypothetical protein ABJB16_13810 [Saprospiraceae bacterium]